MVWLAEYTSSRCWWGRQNGVGSEHCNILARRETTTHRRNLWSVAIARKLRVGIKVRGRPVSLALQGKCHPLKKRVQNSFRGLPRDGRWRKDSKSLSGTMAALSYSTQNLSKKIASTSMRRPASPCTSLHLPAWRFADPRLSAEKRVYSFMKK